MRRRESRRGLVLMAGGKGEARKCIVFEFWGKKCALHNQSKKKFPYSRTGRRGKENMG